MLKFYRLKLVLSKNWYFAIEISWSITYKENDRRYVGGNLQKKDSLAWTKISISYLKSSCYISQFSLTHHCHFYVVCSIIYKKSMHGIWKCSKTSLHCFYMVINRLFFGFPRITGTLTPTNRLFLFTSIQETAQKFVESNFFG